MLIRNYLTKYNGSKEIISTGYETNSNFYLDILKEVHMDGFNLFPRFENQKELAKVIYSDQRYLEMCIKLDAYHSWKSFNEKITKKKLIELLQEIDVFITLIKNKIEKQP